MNELRTKVEEILNAEPKPHVLESAFEKARGCMLLNVTTEDGDLELTFWADGDEAGVERTVRVKLYGKPRAVMVSTGRSEFTELAS